MQENSPGIDAGNNALVSPEILTDFDLLPRFVNPLKGTIDICPYEITVVHDAVNVTLATSNESVILSILDQKGQAISAHELKSGLN